MEKLVLGGVSTRLIEAVHNSARADEQLADAGVLYRRRRNGVTQKEFKVAHDLAVASRGVLRDRRRIFERAAENLLGNTKAASRMCRETIVLHSPAIRRCGMCGGDISGRRLDARWCGGTCYQRSHNVLTGRQRKPQRAVSAGTRSLLETF